MLRFASIAVAVIASLVVVDSLSAQQNNRGQRRRGEFPSVIQMIERNKDLNLTDDQKAKLTTLDKEYAPKQKELAEAGDKVLTADQKKARREALEAARKAGKRGPEVRDSIQAAMKLTDAQKAKLGENRKAMAALRKEVMGKVNQVLTPEQQEVLKKARAQHEGHRNHGGQNQPPKTN